MLGHPPCRDSAQPLSREISAIPDKIILPPAANPNAPTWTADFTGATLPAITFTRASSGSLTSSNGTLTNAGNNVARLDYDPATLLPRGLLIEEMKTNFLLNSATPASQSVSLNAGTYTLWVVGTGSCACAAGTAVGSGFGSASSSSVRTFTVTTAGTVTFNTSGTLSRFQCENGSSATSFINTTTAAATRAADVALVEPIPFFNVQQPGTLVVEAMFSNAAAANSSVLAFTATSGNNLLYQISRNASGTVTGLLRNSASQTVASLNSGVSVGSGSVLKAALAWANTDIAISVNGSAPVASTTGDVATNMQTVARLRLGTDNNSAAPLNGWLRRLAYYPQRLGNATLQTLTT